MAINEVLMSARSASRSLATLTSERKNAALRAMAAQLLTDTEQIVAANTRDVQAAIAEGASAAIVDRLTLTPERVRAMSDDLETLTSLSDPVGEVVRGYTLPNGILLRQIRTPLGVVAVVYEARPNVTVDAAGICVKSGNAAVLRGSSSALQSNKVLVASLRTGLASAGVDERALTLIEDTDRSSVTTLMQARGLIDVIVPRGGAGLINHVVQNSVVPVIETGVGNCHVYIDAYAELEDAERIVLNAKTHRPSVCNAAETLLVHQSVAPEVIPRIVTALTDAGVRIHGDAHVRGLVGDAVESVSEKDWSTEYLDLEIAVAVVESLEAAVEHIQQWSSGHTEAIVSTHAPNIEFFISRVDSASVIVNASTRFTDGGMFGFGAEIGTSTQKLHARGPMGLPELTSTKYVLYGDGQIRS